MNSQLTEFLAIGEEVTDAEEGMLCLSQSSYDRPLSYLQKPFSFSVKKSPLATWALSTPMPPPSM